VILAAALAAQVLLSPCHIEGTPRDAKCGTYKAWEGKDK
jgi:hypothetical protein